jgi:hypothetical protein
VNGEHFYFVTFAVLSDINTPTFNPTNQRPVIKFKLESSFKGAIKNAK